MLSGTSFQSKSICFLLLSLVWLVLFIFLAHEISREDHMTLGLSITGLFIGYFLLIKYNFPIYHLIGLGLLSRVVFLWATPTLSQDFYRFLWDGHLILEGINPYLWTPNELLESGGYNSESLQNLWEGMGTLSQHNYSNYPPIHQIPSGIAGLIRGTSIPVGILVIRCLLIAADIGVLIFGQKLLKLINLPVNHILFYFLNPLVIIELSGNLHHEGLMIFGLTLSLFYLLKQKKVLAGMFMGLSVLTKLIPLLLLPLLTTKLRLKKFYPFYATITIVAVLGFLPFLNHQSTNNYSKTLGLWFNNFEFNASLYGVAKELLKQFFNLNLLSYMSITVPSIIGLITVYYLSKKEVNLSKILTQMMVLLTVYFLISTTIHPWYIVTLVFLSCFTRYRYPIWWSFTIFFSYFSYYDGYVQESHFWKLIQYGVVIGLWGYEFYKLKVIRASSTD